MNEFDFAIRPLESEDAGDLFYHSLPALEEQGLTRLDPLPYCVRVLLESLLRNQPHPAFEADHVRTFARWDARGEDRNEYPYLPARVLLQDFTGVPCVVDLAALRDVMARAGRDPKRIEPLIPVDLVIDHSVQIDATASPDALRINMEKEFERNEERYAFLRWGQGAFRKLSIVPPGVGICHQVNLEHLARCVIVEEDVAGRRVAYPDTLVGTDSHTTMINGIGVLGWGVGGIEAEAAMLGQPIPILTPIVTGVRLAGRLRPGVLATDLALRVTQRLRAEGVVGQFVEFFGPGCARLTLADRATVSNMAPEYGATMGFFPIDDATLRYLRETGRAEEHVRLVERYCRAQRLFRTADAPDPAYSRVLELDLASVDPCVAGPKRPHDCIPIPRLKERFAQDLRKPTKDGGFGTEERPASEGLTHGSIVIASITSCTNTSNPQVLLAAGLLARKARARGLKVPSFVRTTFAPGSRFVTEYLQTSGLLDDLEALGFHSVAYGCATCIGNSGPLDPEIETAIRDKRLVAAAVLSGNRNFEGRIHPSVKANFLASPPLVVAYALAGTVHIDLASEPIGTDAHGRPVFLEDIWPTDAELDALLPVAQAPETVRRLYADLSNFNPAWNAIETRGEPTYAWNPASTYIRNPSFVAEIQPVPDPIEDIREARVLGFFGDFITTDHISPAGSIAPSSPAGRYLVEHGVAPEDFNSYGSRRGNHEVMMRGTFANVRIRNRLLEREGGWTRLLPDGDEMAIYDAAMAYRETGTPLIVLAGKMYGAGSSRDWAAKGTRLLGVRAVIAESFERIHRSNLVEMGVLPLEFPDGQTADSLGLTGREVFAIEGIAAGLEPGRRLAVTARAENGTAKRFEARCRIDTPIEVEYYRHGGILPYVLRALMADADAR